MTEVCKREEADLLLVAGDLFHRQPLLRELKEADSIFASIPSTRVVLIAGNHDYIRKDSYYRSFPWSANVHMLLGKEVEPVEFPEIGTAVYGCSYHDRKNRSGIYDEARAKRLQETEILLAHGGDAEHCPLDRNKMAGLGYAYIALGHIHMPGEWLPGKAAYAGALEPTDVSDLGEHGYIFGEIKRGRCSFSFVPFALRQYRAEQIVVDPGTTGFSLRMKMRDIIERNGEKDIYKFLLKGYRDPDVRFDLESLKDCGNIIDMIDETRPAFDLEKLWRNNRKNLLGKYIESFGKAGEDSEEYTALCEGVSALMETKRGME